jgi:hypothetical protein
MTEKFESAFHKRYVGGEGEVDPQSTPAVEKKRVVTTYEDVLSEYRKYVGDSTAELPEGVIKTLGAIQRTENDGI